MCHIFPLFRHPSMLGDDSMCTTTLLLTSLSRGPEGQWTANGSRCTSHSIIFRRLQIMISNFPAGSCSKCCQGDLG